MPAQQSPKEAKKNGTRTPSQRLRDIFRHPQKSSVRSANDNPAPLRWIARKALSIGVPLLALAALGMAMFLGAR